MVNRGFYFVKILITKFRAYSEKALGSHFPLTSVNLRSPHSYLSLPSSNGVKVLDEAKKVINLMWGELGRTTNFTKKSLFQFSRPSTFA